MAVLSNRARLHFTVGRGPRGHRSEKRPNSNLVCGAVDELHIEGNCSKAEVEVPGVGAVQGAPRIVLNVTCEMDGN